MTKTTRRAVAVLAGVAASVVVAGTAVAADPSVTMDPVGVLSADGRQVLIGGTYRCDPVPGGTQYIYPKVTQTQVPAVAQSAPIKVTCTGVVERWTVVAPTISTYPLVPGPAAGSVTTRGSSGGAAFTTAMVLV
jgi:hypothetical protein